MKRIQFIVSALLLILLLVACAPKAAPAPQIPAPAPAPQVPAPAAAVPTAPAKAAWEEKWEALQEAAKKEGMIMVSSGAPALRTPSEAFGKKYGLKVEYLTTAFAAEDTAKLLAQRRAGLYLVDVTFRGASTPVLMLKPAGVLDPLAPILVLPEVLDPKVWDGGKLPFIDRDHMAIAFTSAAQPTVVINTNLVKLEDIQSYNDLLNPRWKGKIMMGDPTTPGAPAYIGLIADLMGGWDYLRNLAKNEPVVMRDKRLQVEWLAHGKVAISVLPAPTVLIEFMRTRAPIRVMTPKEGTFTSAIQNGVVMRMNRWPHPNAGTLFVNWLLTKEGQTIASQATGAPSVRLDVPTDFIDPVFVRDPKIKYVSSANEEVSIRQEDDMKKLKELFGPLMLK